MSMIDKLAAAGYLTEEQVGRVRGNVRAFVEELDSNPDFESEALAKTASFIGDVGRAVDPAKTVGAVIAAGITTAALTGGKDMYDAVKGKIKHHQSYNAMMDMNPGLKRHDKKMVNAAFNTLHRFNPDYASDPLVAGTFVQNALDMSRIDIGTVNSLVDSSNKLKRESGMSMADAMKFVQFKDEGPHPAQVAAWESSAKGPHPAQVGAWEASRSKATSESRKAQGALLASRTEAKKNLSQARSARAQATAWEQNARKAEAEADFLRTMAGKAKRLP